jgi:NAD(P)-dependent dehydrogenase (short-subunit alcohol dehydrogenase family)
MGFTRSMDHLHPTMNIRCVGLAPGAFQTPLWSEEKKSWMDNTEWLPLGEVVDGMMRCIEDEGIKGGEILEILTGKQRVMPLGGELPSGPGAGPVVEGGEKAAERVVKFLKGEDVKF